jgi:putative IMPACT (imprinted ancient) family translation regulator
MVVVVRYFGGSLLGVPGLINAYKTAAAEAIAQCSVVEKNVEVMVALRFDYTVMNEVMMVIREFQIRIHQQDQGLFCSYTLAIPLEHKAAAMQKLQQIRGLEY